MNLILHQFRKDVRQFFLFLALWFVMLQIDLAVTLGWEGQEEYYSPIYGFGRHASSTWTTMLPGAVWILAGLLPSLIVLADSPSRRDGFLATRPLPKRDLFFAKLLFVLALVVTPWALQEMAHLMLERLPGWAVARGTLERFLFTLPVAVGCGAYASLWPGYARWVRSIGMWVLVCVVTVGALGLGANLFYFNFPLSNLFTAHHVVNFYLLLLAIMTLAIWHARGRPGAAGRWGGLILAVVISQCAAALWPWEFFKLQPESQAQAEAVMAASGFKIPLRNLRVQREQEWRGGDKPRFRIGVTVKATQLPPGYTVGWSGKDANVLRATGGQIRRDGRVVDWELFSGTWGPDFAAWSHEFPDDVLFRETGYQGEPSEVGDLYLGRFELPTKRADFGEPLTARVDLEARVFKWRKIAELPLTPGATSTDEFGSWKCFGTRFWCGADGGGPTIYLERREIELATATDLRGSSVETRLESRFACMVYDPKRHLVFMPDPHMTFDCGTRGGHTALVRHFLVISFGDQKSFLTADLAGSVSDGGFADSLKLSRYRLIILEKSWIGSVLESWKSDPFTLDENLQPPSIRTARHNEPLPEAEFKRRIAALAVPAPDASRTEFSMYLLEFLRLVEVRSQPLLTSDPLTAQLARFVPTQLDVLLDGLAAMADADKATVLNAIELGATDAQKPMIIAALPRYPELAGVLLGRDWVEEARPQINQMVKSSPRLPLSALRAIAWFRDPRTYPRLLEEFEAHPTVLQDEFLRTLPGIQTELDAIVARRWREEKLVWREPNGPLFGDVFKLAMQRGDVTALQRVYQVLNDPNFDQRNNAMNLGVALAQTVQLTGLNPDAREEDQPVIAWMRQHRPEDFVFSPARRQFVLRQNP